MENKINTGWDGASYDYDPYQPNDSISDANNLYQAWLDAQKGSAWKPKVQMFEMDWLSNIAHIQKELDNRTYRLSTPTQFIINERGKPRVIRGEQVRDRVVEHSLNDNVVVPSILKYLIYDNGASLRGKGIDFTRERLVKHLINYYNHYGNDGYVLLIDFKKYYDNIRHDILLEQFKKYIHDDTALWLLEMIVDNFKIDVSYMDDEDYQRCMDLVFNMMEYDKLDKSLFTGKKYMRKHLDIGNQTSQSAGILYPTPIDNYIKIVKGMKYYGRYMDDAYVLCDDKQTLKYLMNDILEVANKQGIVINTDKTHIVKISDQWRFLQVQYSLTDTGRIIRKINPRQVTIQRRKMKKLAPIMEEKEYKDWVYCWLKSHKKYLSKKQYSNIVELYNKTKEDNICTNSH